MTKMSYICPVCGFPELEENPEYIGSFEICSSCRFQFGVTDDDKGYTYEQWRNKWIAEGMRWGGSNAAPENWNPVEQLKNIGIILNTK